MIRGMNQPVPPPLDYHQYVHQQCYLALEAMRLGYAQDTAITAQILTTNIIDRLTTEQLVPAPPTRARHSVQRGTYTK